MPSSRFGLSWKFEKTGLVSGNRIIEKLKWLWNVLWKCGSFWMLRSLVDHVRSLHGLRADPRFSLRLFQTHRLLYLDFETRCIWHLLIATANRASRRARRVFIRILDNRSDNSMALITPSVAVFQLNSWVLLTNLESLETHSKVKSRSCFRVWKAKRLTT